VINRIEFSARNLTSNACLLLIIEHFNKSGIFDLIDHDLVFENASINKIKMSHIKTMFCGNGSPANFVKKVDFWMSRIGRPLSKREAIHAHHVTPT